MERSFRHFVKLAPRSRDFNLRRKPLYRKRPSRRCGHFHGIRRSVWLILQFLGTNNRFSMWLIGPYLQGPWSKHNRYNGFDGLCTKKEQWAQRIHSGNLLVFQGSFFIQHSTLTKQKNSTILNSIALASMYTLHQKNPFAWKNALKT